MNLKKFPFSEYRAHVPGGVDEILQVLAGLAQDEAPGIFAMPFGVQPEVQCDGP